jgi:hypothetical protein
MSDLAAARIREQEYRKLYDEVGGVRFEMGVTNAIRQHSGGFFPVMADFIGYVPTHVGKLVTCSSCENSGGFVIVKVMRSGKFFDVARSVSMGVSDG